MDLNSDPPNKRSSSTSSVSPSSGKNVRKASKLSTGAKPLTDGNRDPRSDRLMRMLEIIGLLQSSRINAAGLETELGVSRRTVHRDIRALQLAGVPIEFSPELKTYRLSENVLLPATNFTTEEALALLVLCTDIGQHATLPFFEPARSAALKLITNLPRELAEHVRATNQVLQIRLHKVNPLDEARTYFDQLVDAFRQRLSVRIEYQGPLDKEPFSTRLNPYQVLFHTRSWYVIGRSSLHRETRTFHIGRIRRMEITDTTYHIPHGWTIDRYLGNAWRLIPEPGPDHHVVVRFDPLVAQNVAEVQWHKSQQIVLNDDGSIDYHVDVSGLNEISWWILGYGRNAEVLQPIELRQIIALHLRDMSSRYAAELNEM